MLRRLLRGANRELHESVTSDSMSLKSNPGWAQRWKAIPQQAVTGGVTLSCKIVECEKRPNLGPKYGEQHDVIER